MSVLNSNLPSHPIMFADRFCDNGRMQWGDVHTFYRDAEDAAKKLKQLGSDVIPVRWSDEKKSYRELSNVLYITIDPGVQLCDNYVIKDNHHRLFFEVQQGQSEHDAIIAFICSVFDVPEADMSWLQKQSIDVYLGGCGFSSPLNWEIKNPDYVWKQWGYDYHL